ncbi:MAG TPA: serine hydrolase domain-containing protein [Mycobacteriales bacterium]|jgi:CubicO group peptidase (beta-lactamase class C family)|nr:serine hydrolase domain-containing protein [Mycobacteriales bacterium]
MQLTADPDKLGFDPARLARIDEHFAQYVDDGRLAGWQIAVTRRGETVHASTYGQRDREAGLPVEPDTLWRIYSMTKPVTSVAAMQLWEQGKFQLTDEVSRYIPSFADVRVYEKGSSQKPWTVPATEPVRVWHLLTHTAGLTYGFIHTAVADAIYRARGYEWGVPPGTDLAGACDAWAAMPLLFQPGSRWGYSVATDVLGRLVEVLSGQRLDDYVAEHITGPLGMVDTSFWVEPARADRLAALYTPSPADGLAVRLDSFGNAALTEPTFLSGGGGLVSTAADYARFTAALLGGGEAGGARLLGSRTLAMMTQNHLPGGQDLGALSTGGFAETTFEGIGFGLGFAVVEDPRPGKTLASKGEFFWGGAASTAFWVDPAEEVTALLFTQLLPSSTHPLRPQLRQLVYSALVD